MSGVGNPLAGRGRLSYLEIPALDARQSAHFYAQVVGWQIDQRASDDFRFSDADGLLIGRWIRGRVAAREPGLLPFLYVDAMERAIDRVTTNGGEVVEGARPEGNLLVARVRDPAGNLMGLWQFAP